MAQRLGQHFLNAPWVARDLVQALDLQRGEIVLEIGPGTGALTKRLLETGARVIAIEKDEALVERLRATFAEEITSGQLDIRSQDIRDFDTTQLSPGYFLAANIPYYITGEIIRMFLETKNQPRAMALLIQKEVAERIVARDEKESLLSLSVKVFGDPSILIKVPRGCFNPPPSVDSAILLVKNISRSRFSNSSERRFFEVLHAGFSSKRKLLASNLKKISPNPLLQTCGINANARAEDVSLEAWLCIARNTTPNDQELA